MPSRQQDIFLQVLDADTRNAMLEQYPSMAGVRYTPMVPVDRETFVSESQRIDWLDPPEEAIGIPLSTLLSRILGDD
jgi:hypothetical protein